MKERYEAIEKLIQKKQIEIDNLQYELTLLQRDCVTEFKRQPNLCLKKLHFLKMIC